jgi:hypothetical protein
MQFKTLPDWYPGKPRLRELAQQFHALGAGTFYRFIQELMAGELPNSGIVLMALERPGDFDLIDASEPPPLVPGGPEPPLQMRHRFAVRRAP